ncbi:MAG: histidine kinase [Verrucomicrobiota bacterium]
MSGRSITANLVARVAFIVLLLAGSSVFAKPLVPPISAGMIVVTNVLQLRHLANDNPPSLVALSLLGTIVDENIDLGIIVFQDDSGTEILQTTLADRPLYPGQRVCLHGTSFARSAAYGVDLDRGPLIDNDGLHPELERSGSIYLRKGNYPIQVLWFNYTSFRSLSLDYSGPDFARRKIPDSALIRSKNVRPDGSTNFIKGLNYQCFEGPWRNLATLRSSVPVKTGFTSNVDLSVTTRDEHVALAFDGLIQIDADGLYNFYLGSDDGSQLFIRDTFLQLTLTGMGVKPVARKIAVGQPLSVRAGAAWTEVDGTVTFVGSHEYGTGLELSDYGANMGIVVRDAFSQPPRYLLGSLVRLKGLCLDRSDTDGHRLADMLVVPNWEDVRVLRPNLDFWSSARMMSMADCQLLKGQHASDIVRVCGKLSSPASGQFPVLKDETGSVVVEPLNSTPVVPGAEVECLGRWVQNGTNNVLQAAILQKLPSHLAAQSIGIPELTTAAEVQRLTRSEARRGYPARIRGVVSWVSGAQNGVVIQDSTRGVSVAVPSDWNWNPHTVGEIVEVEGSCDAGQFSPIVLASKMCEFGPGVLPDPQHPTYDQLIRGSMDSQYVEIRGYVTGARDHHLILLMQGGKIDVEFEPSPLDDLSSFVNAVVRIRGCMFAKWDLSTLLVTPDHPLWFGNSIICEDVPPPSDFFDARKMQARELMQFDASANFFQRIRVSGQVLAGDQKTCYCSEDGFGFRFELAKPENLNPGDEVEVVGMVDLDSASPTLREAVVKKTGQAPLPVPQPFDFSSTNVVPDTTRVRVDGLLLDVKNSVNEREMQMQIGTRVFPAILRGKDRLSAQWQVGSRLRVTGVLVDLGARAGGALVQSFQLLINSDDDVVLVARPPWWTLWRLLAVAGILTAGLVLAFVWISLLRREIKRRTAQLKHEIGERQRVEQVRAIELERARIAQDLHDDLGGRVTAISMLATACTGKDVDLPASQRHSSLILERSRSLVAALDELVWAVNPQYDTVKALTEYLAGVAEELLTETGIALRVEIPSNLPQRMIPAETRHNLFLAAKESINNAIRHGRPREVLLQVSITDRELEVLIRDNGCGFDLTKPVKPVSGDGLGNLPQRMGKIGGRCSIESEPGKGTSVFLILPF